MNIRKSVGPRTDPWGTPLVIGNSADRDPQTLTLEDRPEIKLVNQLESAPCMPSLSQCEIVVSWGITSKAFEKSKNMQPIFFFVSAASERFPKKRARLDKQEREGRNPCWAGWSSRLERRKDCMERLIIFSITLHGMEVRLIGL
jgi:hypothetical protein